ncbi:Cyclopentanol dehydrogenase [Roseivivax jejudonensis]|uniref:Cyclopentanol dehydrogenase n=1 Tax=Roseivivax jejudonensis TaxID=1529041 RepID=A0A1X6YP03_9RHOB|nr:Cyclopentanol dehydrogenase [Roseivivax jejudonensis]
MAEELRATGAAAHFLATDLRDPAASSKAVEAAIEIFGRLDVVINNAGVLIQGTAEDTSDADWDHIMDVNLGAVFRLSRAAIPALRAHRGCIVNIASDWALTGARGAVAYAVSKAAVAQLTRCMALDRAADGIRVNAVCPGDTDTQMLTAGLSGTARAEALAVFGASVPLGRVATPVDIARVTAFLASEGAAYMTGALVPVDGGATAG